MRKQIAVVGAVVVIGVVVFTLAFHRLLAISDRSLLREAVRAEKHGGPGRIDEFFAIFQQQVKQGYYDDALETMRQEGRFEDFYFARFAKAFATNGDVQSAKRMVNEYSNPLRNAGLKAIAIAQASKGDESGARETSATLSDKDKDEVRDVICFYHIKSGDLESAIRMTKEADQQRKGAGAEMLFAISERLSLSEPAGHEKVLRLASYIKERRAPKELLYWAASADSDEIGCCGASAKSGPLKRGFAYADACAGYGVILVDERSEPLHIALKKYEAGDVAGAEKELRDNPSLGLKKVISVAVERGDIKNALHFLDLLRPLEPDDSSGDVSDSARSIAAAWARKDDPRTVVKWARSRPTSYERAMALLGVAEAIGHSR